MKRVLVVLLLVAVLAGVYFTYFQDKNPLTTGAIPVVKSTPTATQAPASNQPPQTVATTQLEATFGDNATARDQDELLDEEEVIPAAKKYKSAEEAMAAVKEAAKSYDDIVLQQFVQPGDDCTWCDAFYGSLRTLLKEPGDAEQRGFYAELLSVSGRLDNAQYLVESAKSAASQDEKEIFTEALELMIGNDDIVGMLGNNLDTQDQTVKESLVAAISNQGSLKAASLLYKNAVDSKNPDGYYSIGVGLGELVPDEEAYNFLQEGVLKRDDYSHLAVKSLLNAGVGGVKLVFDALLNSKDPEGDRKFLTDATDHVAYDEEVKQYLTQMSTSQNLPPALKEFTDTVLKEFAEEEAEELE